MSLLEPPSPLSTTLPDACAEESLSPRTTTNPMSPRKPVPAVPSFLAVDSSDAEKLRAYANLAIALNQTLPLVLENQETQGGMILAYTSKVDLLNHKVDGLVDFVTKTSAAEAKAVARGWTIAAMPSFAPPPAVLELDEEPTHHGQHATVKITTLENAREQFSQVDQDKRAALAAVKILQDEKAQDRKRMMDTFTVWGIVAVPVIMTLFWCFEHLVLKQ